MFSVSVSPSCVFKTWTSWITMLSTGTAKFNQTSDFGDSLIWKNAATLVRFVVQSQYHQPNLPLKSFRSKLFYTVKWKSFSCWNIQLNRWSTGIHFVLFCICMFILVRNSLRRPTQWFILVSAFVMFALSTADISITFRFMTHDILEVLEQGSGSYLVRKFQFVKSHIFVSNKSVFFP